MRPTFLFFLFRLFLFFTFSPSLFFFFPWCISFCICCCFAFSSSSYFFSLIIQRYFIIKVSHTLQNKNTLHFFFPPRSLLGHTRVRYHRWIFGKENNTIATCITLTVSDDWANKWGKTQLTLDYPSPGWMNNKKNYKVIANPQGVDGGGNISWIGGSLIFGGETEILLSFADTHYSKSNKKIWYNIIILILLLQPTQKKKKFIFFWNEIRGWQKFVGPPQTSPKWKTGGQGKEKISKVTIVIAL